MDYLLETEVEDYNEHWLPYYLLCTPCHLNYTVIAKTEDIQGDSRYGNRIVRKKILCISSDIFWKY